jgi:hypothetical protein
MQAEEILLDECKYSACYDVLMIRLLMVILSIATWDAGASE